MSETFRDIIAEFPDRATLATEWDRQVQPVGRRVTIDAVNMWHHRNGIPSWSWAGLVAAAKELKKSKVTLQRLALADVESRRQRAEARQSVPEDQKGASAIPSMIASTVSNGSPNGSKTPSNASKTSSAKTDQASAPEAA